MTWVVIASGQSLTTDQVDIVRIARSEGRIKGFVAVSNVALDHAPDADAIVSHDESWWRANPEAFRLSPPKFCRMHVHGFKTFVPFINAGCNSGLMAMDVAFRIYKARKIVLLGFDMHGTHYFGSHPECLKNTSDIRFKEHIRQFEFWNGCPVVNCTPNSALKKFPFMDLKDAVS